MTMVEGVAQPPSRTQGQHKQTGLLMPHLAVYNTFLR
jgi:hypothetical protein